MRLVLASRVHKLVPLLVLVVNAALVAGGPVSIGACLWGLTFLLLVSVLGMQLNVITDAALDQRSKPRLLRWLTERPELLRQAIVVELFGGAATLAASIWFGGVALGLALSCYAAAFLFYSYNFFAGRDGARSRLKVYWWGNAATVFLGYLALWIAGFVLAQLSPERWVWYVSLAAVLCGIDYAVFLNECAGDAPAEREQGLRTLPALIGAPRTSALALLLLAACAAVLVRLLATRPPLSGLTLAALCWHAAVQAASALSAFRRLRGGSGGGELLADFGFWISRVGAFALLLGGSWASR